MKQDRKVWLWLLIIAYCSRRSSFDSLFILLMNSIFKQYFHLKFETSAIMNSSQDHLSQERDMNAREQLKHFVTFLLRDTPGPYLLRWQSVFCSTVPPLYPVATSSTNGGPSPI